MKCRKMFFLELLVFFIALSGLSFLSFATNDETPEIVEDAQTETAEPSRSEDTEAQELVQDEQSDIDFEPDTSGLEAPGSYEQFEVEYDDQAEYIQYNDYEYETLLTLKSIEYQLKIIAGGMILAVCSLFIWYTILKPIKRMTQI